MATDRDAAGGDAQDAARHNPGSLRVEGPAPVRLRRRRHRVRRTGPREQDGVAQENRPRRRWLRNEFDEATAQERIDEIARRRRPRPRRKEAKPARANATAGAEERLKLQEKLSDQGWIDDATPVEETGAFIDAIMERIAAEPAWTAANDDRFETSELQRGAQQMGRDPMAIDRTLTEWRKTPMAASTSERLIGRLRRRGAARADRAERATAGDDPLVRQADAESIVGGPLRPREPRRQQRGDTVRRRTADRDRRAVEPGRKRRGPVQRKHAERSTANGSRRTRTNAGTGRPGARRSEALSKAGSLWLVAHSETARWLWVHEETRRKRTRGREP